MFRVGILGVASISSKTALAISNDESDCCVAAVASRSLKKAANFVKEHCNDDDDDDISVYSGPNAYDKLIQNSKNTIDAVYVPLPTTMKKSWVIKALKAGMHVVLEKPAALNQKDYEEMLSVAYQQNKFLLDGTMFPHHPRTNQILNNCNNNSNNESNTNVVVNRIATSFTFQADQNYLTNNIRCKSGKNGDKDDAGDPHGCIGDLGWYCIRFGLMVCGANSSSVVVRTVQVVDYQLNQHGVPIDVTFVVRFGNKDCDDNSDNKVLWCHCGFTTPFRQNFEVCCTENKTIIVDDLVLPVQSKDVSFLVRSSSLTKNDLLTVHETETVRVDDNNTPQETLLWKTFQRISKSLDAAAATSATTDTITGGWVGDTEDATNEANKWASISLTNQKVVDALMESIEKKGQDVVVF